MSNIIVGCNARLGALDVKARAIPPRDVAEAWKLEGR
jgi:hypothetical protein